VISFYGRPGIHDGCSGHVAAGARAVLDRESPRNVSGNWTPQTPYRNSMTRARDDTVQAISQLLHQAAETHHIVFAISDGDDADWASWYADWLTNLSALPRILRERPVRSKLTWLLVGSDREFMRVKPAQPWEDFYAQRWVRHFANNS
jgi:hypothetical protein